MDNKGVLNRVSNKKVSVFLEARLGMHSFAFLVMQFIFFFCDLNSWWSPKFSEGGLFERIMNSQFFTETFAPYKTSQFNLYTAFLPLHYYHTH